MQRSSPGNTRAEPYYAQILDHAASRGQANGAVRSERGNLRHSFRLAGVYVRATIDGDANGFR